MKRAKIGLQISGDRIWRPTRYAIGLTGVRDTSRLHVPDRWTSERGAARVAKSHLSRAERVGINEAIFREVDERMRDLNDEFAALTGTCEIVCECGELTCVERAVVAPGDYKRVRQRAELFVVATGHVVAGYERVLEEHTGYVVVEKLGEAAQTARKTESPT